MLLKTQENAFGTKPFFGFKAIHGRKLGADMLLKTNRPAFVQRPCEAIFEVQSHLREEEREIRDLGLAG